MVRLKRHHFLRARAVQRLQNRYCLLAVFHAWKAAAPVSDCSSWMRLCDRTIALHLWQYQRLSRCVTKAVRLDDKNFYVHLAAKKGEIAADEGMNRLWASIKPLLPKNIKRRSQQNIRCRGPTNADLMNHYCSLEAGEPCDYASLLSRCFEDQKSHIDDAPLGVDLAHVPSRLDVEMIARRVKSRKAPGLDTVLNEHLRCQALAFSSAFHSLFFKSWLTSAEPSQFKGGLVWTITKKKISMHAADMRGIVLLDGIGKLGHALRLRLFGRLALQHGLSTAIVFLDVPNAFHCLLREHVFGTCSAFPPVLADLLTREGLSAAQLESEIQNHASSFEQTVAPVTARILKDAHTHTWFASPHEAQCYTTARGSRPGSPVADIAYNLLMVSILRELQPLLRAHPQVLAASSALGIEVPVIAWVDDVAFPVITETAALLDITVAHVMVQVHQVFAKYGLRLNMSPGKTEALSYEGEGAADCRRARFIDDHGRLPVPDHPDLHVVVCYTHLGTIASQSMSVAAELKTRVGKASNAFRQMRETIFHNRHIPVRTRLQLLEPLVLSILMYGR